LSFVRAIGPLPQIQCVMKDGTKVVGTFTLQNGRIGKVDAVVIKVGEPVKK
jgi:hypothetical protein